jgi:hypothetical protein
MLLLIPEEQLRITGISQGKTRMKKVNVTGQTRLNGYHVCQELADGDYHAVIADGLCTTNISKAKFYHRNPEYPPGESLKETIRYIIT